MSPHSAGLIRDTADRAVAVERELKDFSYMVSHDLAASFRHVSEFSRLLTAEVGGGLTSRQRTYADYIHSAALRCQAMMDQMLAFTQAQQTAIAPTRHDATLTMQLAVRQLANLETSGAEVTLAPLGEVFADAKLLAIAFGRLLDNAIKFHPPGVRPQVAIEPAHDADAWRVRITDNGIGVAPEHAERTFQMFRRLNGEDDFPGVGAGLAICRRLARRHGGDVCFVDCAHGACVELSLPHDAPAPRSNLGDL
jgi:light-regulated signal transduction histidine kinase (bacteriophytochrome)